MQGLLCKFHMYLEKINFHYLLKLIPGNLSLSLSLLCNFHFTLSPSSRCQTPLTQICQQICPGTSPGISSVQLVMHLCRVTLWHDGRCLLWAWYVSPSKESWTQIRFGSRKLQHFTVAIILPDIWRGIYQ